MPVHQTPQGTTKASASRAAQRKRLKKIHVAKADNGGFVVTHHHHPEHGGTPAAAKHVFADYEGMHQHVEQTMRGHK